MMEAIDAARRENSISAKKISNFLGRLLLEPRHAKAWDSVTPTHHAKAWKSIRRGPQVGLVATTTLGPQRFKAGDKINSGPQVGRLRVSP